MKLRILALLMAFALINSQCKKETTEISEAVPSADFSFDKTEYGAFETITLSNTSSNASTFRWTLPDGTTSKSKDLVYALGDTDDGSLLFKLEAISQSGMLLDYSTKKVSIKSGTGQVVFYSNNFYEERTLIIDNGPEIKVNLATYVQSASCGQSGCYTMNIKKGFHTVKWYPAAGFNDTKNFTVTTNGCVSVGLN